MPSLLASTSNVSSPSTPASRGWWGGEGSLPFFSLLVAAIVWYAFLIAKAWGKRRPRLPPGPRGVPFFGSLPFLDRNLHHHLTKLSQTYGPIMNLRLGRRLCVVVSSASVAKELLRDQDTAVANHDVPTAALVLPNGRHGLAWSPHGHQWRMLRRLAVCGMLSSASLEPFRGIRSREIRRMVGRVDQSAASGSPLQLRELVYSTLYNVITGMLWGGIVEAEEISGVLNEFRELVESIGGTFGRLSISDFFPFLAPLDLDGLAKKRKQIAEKLHRLLDCIIEQRRRKSFAHGDGQDDEDFLQSLLRTKDKADPAVPLTVDQIKGLLMDLVMAGMDTTTSTVEWAMAELMNHPVMVKKVQEELDQEVGSEGPVEETHLPKLRYLNAVIKETLRLHPAAPVMLPRTPSQPCTAGGYTIPAGCRVMVNVWGMERDPEAWDEPSEFRPDRFLDGRNWDFSGNDFHFFPFGTGRRICPGAALADRMLSYSLAMLLRLFEWRLPEGSSLDLSEKFGVVMKKEVPLVLVPVRRFSDPDLYY